MKHGMNTGRSLKSKEFDFNAIFGVDAVSLIHNDPQIFCLSMFFPCFIAWYLVVLNMIRTRFHPWRKPAMHSSRSAGLRNTINSHSVASKNASSRPKKNSDGGFKHFLVFDP